jgi:hypothetical protein
MSKQQAQCCFCGAVHLPHEPIGYAGEKTCRVCGKGGHGEPDEDGMFYKRALPSGVTQ